MQKETNKMGNLYKTGKLCFYLLLLSKFKNKSISMFIISSALTTAHVVLFAERFSLFSIDILLHSRQGAIRVLYFRLYFFFFCYIFPLKTKLTTLFITKKEYVAIYT